MTQRKKSPELTALVPEEVDRSKAGRSLHSRRVIKSIVERRPIGALDMAAGMTTRASKNEADSEDKDQAKPPEESGARVVSSRPEIEAGRSLIHEVWEVDNERSAVVTAGHSKSLPVPKAQKVLDEIPPSNIDQLTEEELIVETPLLNQLSELLEEDTLEAAQKFMKLLDKNKLAAHIRWNKLHPKGMHNLSENGPHKVNEFAKWVVDTYPLRKGQVLFELGCGVANDSVYFAQNSEAHITGIDASPDAIERAEEYARVKQLKGRLDLGCSNFMDVLKVAKGSNLDGIYSHSTYHYTPSRVFEQVILPMTADALRPSQYGDTPGKCFIALKTAKSASAQKPWQHKLLAGHPAGPSFDLRDKTFRNYFENLQAVLDHFEPSFDIKEAFLFEVPNYDTTGDVEEFAGIVGIPRALRKTTKA